MFLLGYVLGSIATAAAALVILWCALRKGGST